MSAASAQARPWPGRCEPSYGRYSSSARSALSALPGSTQTDQQSFCYDEQNRLVCASSQTATGPNGCASNTAGSLTGQSAQYTASYSYDTLGRLTSSPLGSYTYGPGMQAQPPAAASPLHAVLSIGTGGGGSPPVNGRTPTSTSSTAGGQGPGRGSGPAPAPGGGFSAPPYSAKYDGAGNMTCRSTSTVLTASCWSTYTGGAQLGYDNEGRLVSWQNTPSSPTTTVSDAYDGAGSRVAQRVTVSGTTTTTYYLAGGLAEIANPSSVLTNYYSVPGVCSAVSVGATLSYLATDGLGSVTTALSSTTASVTAQQLYGPYGNVRYSSGGMPTARGYTGQYADAATGLDYDHARYYDPVANQFVSADSVLPGKGYDPWGLSRYGYVEGNPETATDPTGHRRECQQFDDSCGGGGSGGGSGGSGGGSGGKGGGGNPGGSPCGGCNARTNPSGNSGNSGCDKRCQYQMQKIAALRNQAGWWGIAGTGLAFFADLGRFVFHLKDGAFFKAILDGLSLLSELTAFLQEIGDKVGGSWQSALYNISSVIQQGIGVLNFARGIVDMPFVGELVATYVGKFATWIMPALEGPAGIGMAIVETSLGEAAADFISAGAHWA